MKKKYIILIIPLTIMIFYILYQYYLYLTKEYFVYFPIVGYDPRDILKGNYLSFKILYSEKVFQCDKEKEIQCGCIEFKTDNNNQQIGYISKLEICPKIDCNPFLYLECKNREYIIPHTQYFITEESLNYFSTVPENSYILLRINKKGQSNIDDLFVYNLDQQKLFSIKDYIKNKKSINKFN